MKKLALIIFLISLGVANLRADDQMATVQQELKDQGFYYGQVDGQPGAETSAAIRRYQIRNGLQVSGTLTQETLDSLKGRDHGRRPGCHSSRSFATSASAGTVGNRGSAAVSAPGPAATAHPAFAAKDQPE